MIQSKLRGLGPGLLVTAAFIGPGTVTTASKAGVGFGLALLWTVVFATLATIVLQEMAARLGLVGRQGLGDVIRTGVGHGILRWAACGLVILAICFGNAAYQTGNLTGAALGLELIAGMPPAVWVVVLSSVAAALLWTGAYRVIERVLVGLVVLMSIMFVATAIIVRPDLGQVVRAMLVPKIPDGSLVVIVGMIGTTVVPYNLFLHATAVQQRWSETLPLDVSLAEVRLDNGLSIALGGIVTMAIVISGAAVRAGDEVNSAADMASQLQPLLGGSAAMVLFAVGLFAAGMTSAVTAPLAAAYATAGALGWSADLKSWRLRLVWLVVLLAGTTLAVLFGKSPTQTILVAQVANGLLLPVIAILLLVAMNRRSLLKEHTNGTLANVLGVAVVLVTMALGAFHVLTGG